MGTTDKDYYQTLGVQKNATQDEIRSAYRRKAMLFHPDKQAGKSDAEKKDAEEKFKEINEAYETLSDPNRRQQYDNPNPFGNVHFSFGGDEGSDFDDIDPMFDFWKRFRRGMWRTGDPNAPRKGEDINLILNIQFMEAITGCTKKIRLEVADNGPNNTRVPKTITIEVKIPAGINQYQRLRLGGQGNRGYNGGPNGNIYLEIHIAEHGKFQRRNGYDIYSEIKVPFETLVLGGEVEIEMLDGSKVKHTICPLTHPNEEVVFQGKGVPVMGTLNTRGVFVAVLALDFPESLTDKEQKLLEKYAKEREKSAKL